MSAGRSSVLRTLVVALLAVTGCGGDDFSNAISASGASCTVNTDCADPLVCALGRCRSACNGSRDCPEGARCVTVATAGVCQLSSEQPCQYASDCPPPLACGVDAQCRSQCAADRDCLAGQRCASGTCADPTELGDDGDLPHLLDAGADAGQDAAPDAPGDSPADSPADAPSDADGGPTGPITCAPGVSFCAADQYLTCPTGGGAFGSTACGGTAPVCWPSLGGCVECQPGVATCMGGQLQPCGADGKAGAGQTCSEAWRCDPAAVKCVGAGRATRVFMTEAIACALVDLGGSSELRCWGDGRDGCLGGAPYEIRAHATALPGLGAVTALAGGRYHVCALVGAELRCWGNNAYGQLGIGTTGDERVPPTPVSGLGAAAVGLAATDFGTCAIVAGGSVRCWGSNDSGTLGAPGPDSAAPVSVPGVSGVSQLAASSADPLVCARIGTTAVTCWGNGLPGPTPIQGVTDAQEIAIVSQGQLAVVVRASDGSLSYALQSASTFGPLTPFASGAASIGSGGPACVRLASGSVATYELPNAPAVVSGSPSTVAEIACGTQSGCVRTDDGNVLCWGIAWPGKLGNDAYAGSVTSPVVVPWLSGVVELRFGSSLGVARLLDGSLVAWGGGDALGLSAQSQPIPIYPAGSGNTLVGLAGGVDSPYDPVLYVGTPKSLGVIAQGALSTTARLAGAGYDDLVHLVPGALADFGLRSSGSVVAYVADSTANDTGILGDGTTTTPAVGTTVTIPGTQGAIGLAMRHAHEHACVWFGDGSLRCWGSDENGEVGDGTTGTGNVVSAPHPVAVGASKVADAAAGRWHTCAVVESGKVVCWGLAMDGQLGFDPGTQYVLTPTVVPGISDAARVVAGDRHTCVVHRTGEVSCFGANEMGQVGDGTTTPAFLPKKLALSGVVDMAAGLDWTCAVHADGTVSCWGDNIYETLGLGSPFASTRPQPVQGL